MTTEGNVNADFVDFLKALNAHGVEYIVIGGHAVSFHGRPRHTGDMDIVIKPTAENAERVVKAVDAFGAGQLGYTMDDYLSGDFIQFGVVPVRIDITTTFDGVDREKLWSEAMEGVLGGVPVKFPSREALIANKRRAGRDKDLNDVKALEAEPPTQPRPGKKNDRGPEL